MKDKSQNKLTLYGYLYGRKVYSVSLWDERARVLGIRVSDKPGRNRIFTILCPSEGCTQTFKTTNVTDIKTHVCINCFCAKKTRKPFYHTHWLAMQRDAARRGIPFDIPFEQFQILCRSKSCFYCSANLKRAPWASQKSVRSYAHNFDRMDSSGPYHITNIAPCCGACNRQKRSSPAREWLTVIALRQGRLSDAGRWCTISDEGIADAADAFRQRQLAQIESQDHQH